LLSPTEMAIATGDGPCPATMPTVYTVVYR
jgi:hypothetical protein